MSDLAPFLKAAYPAIRDKVVDDFVEENARLRAEVEGLKRTLRRQNPRRAVELRISRCACGSDVGRCSESAHRAAAAASGEGGGAATEQGDGAQRATDLLVLASTTFSMTDVNSRIAAAQNNARRDLFPSTNPSGRIPQYHWSALQSVELWVDGGPAVRLRDLSFYYRLHEFISAEVAEELGGPTGYAVVLQATNADESVEFSMGLYMSPEDHNRLFVGMEPEIPLDRRDYTVPSDRPVVIPSSRLFGGSAEAPVLDKNSELQFWPQVCSASAEFLNAHLTVPYVPPSDI